MADLKPCPFCGGEVKLNYVGGDSYIPYYFISCKECGCKQASSIHKEAVINAWNTRKPMEAVVAELEKEITIVEGERTEDIPITRFMWNQALANAISIVRGKE